MSYLTESGDPNVRKIVTHAATFLVIFLLLLSSFGTISAGERGVKTRLGAVVGVVEPGLYVKVPFIEKVNTMDVRTRTINYDKNGNEGDEFDTSLLTGSSKDLQEVKIGVVVNYHLDPVKADVIYAQYKSTENYELNVIEPIVRKEVKSLAAQYTAEELVTKRTEFSDRVNGVIADELTSVSALFESLNVTHFEFSPSFREAIEAKVTAVQNAEAQKNKLEQVKYEAQQTIETAKATAEAQRIQSQSLAAQGGEDYVMLQWIEAWRSGGALVPQFVTSENAGGFIMNMNR